jgi:NodT family efflux transporter outer membrane factor (OMF) lipoprotein
LKNGIFIYNSAKLPAGTTPGIFVLCAWAMVWLAGCSPRVAHVDLPYDTLQSFSLPGGTEAPDQWWLAFKDNELNSLMDTALHSNLSLNTVWYQFEEAGALVDVVSSEKWPEVFLELQSGISRPEPDFVGGENTQLSLRSNYEVDLWGRIRHSVQAEANRFKASYYDYKTAEISLSGEIALTWFRLKATKYQLQLIDSQVETNEQVLALIRARFASGQVRGVDILRQQQLIENTKEQKISFELQMEILKNQLSILLGQPPGLKFDIKAQLPTLPPLPRTGIPLQLANRRPDVQSAFYRLQASDREMAAAISNKYPRLNFSLTGAIRSNTLTGLFESQAISVSSSLLAPIFYGGRLNAEVDRTEAIRKQFLNDYGQTVLLAFQEIEDALVQETKQIERIEIIEKQVQLAERTFEQLRMEYPTWTSQNQTGIIL